MKAKTVYYNIKMDETRRDQLIRYLSDCAQYNINQQHQIKEANHHEEIYDANTRSQLNSLTAQLKWYNNIINILREAKKI